MPSSTCAVVHPRGHPQSPLLVLLLRCCHPRLVLSSIHAAILKVLSWCCCFGVAILDLCCRPSTRPSSKSSPGAAASVLPSSTCAVVHPRGHPRSPSLHRAVVFSCLRAGRPMMMAMAMVMMMMDTAWKSAPKRSEKENKNKRVTQSIKN